MEPRVKVLGMLKTILRFAGNPKEVSCIIGHLFTELEPPCGDCDAGGVVMRGTAFNGERVS